MLSRFRDESSNDHVARRAQHEARVVESCLALALLPLARAVQRVVWAFGVQHGTLALLLTKSIGGTMLEERVTRSRIACKDIKTTINVERIM